MKFQAVLKKVFLDPSQPKILDQFVKERVEDAAKEWVERSIEQIPVWSGAARATLQQAGALVGVSVPINPKRSAPDRIALGRANSDASINRVNLAYYQFYWRSRLAYMGANETKVVGPGEYGVFARLIKPTPWMFRMASNNYAATKLLGRAPILPLRSETINV